VSFKAFLNEEIVAKAPKPNKIEFKINLKEYKETVSKSILVNTRKTIMQRVNDKGGDIPIYCEELKKFFVLNTNDKKLRAKEVKSREEKELCGALLNGMIVNEHEKGNKQGVKQLLEMKIGWEVPSSVYGHKNEFGKTISFK
jgi:hypothetical protein